MHTTLSKLLFTSDLYSMVRIDSGGANTDRRAFRGRFKSHILAVKVEGELELTREDSVNANVS